MSFPSLRSTLFVAALGLCGAGVTGGVALAERAVAAGEASSADPGVVVLAFDGDEDLALVGRSVVLGLVDRDYDLVPPRMWRDALDMEKRGRGRKDWAKAATDIGVAAVIEGAAVKSRSGGQLRIWVRDAHTGKIAGEVTAPLTVDGLDEEAKATLEMELVDALFAATDSDVAARKRAAKRAPRGERAEVGSAEVAPAKEGEPRAPRVASETKVDVASSQVGLEKDRLALFDAPQTDGSSLPASKGSARLARPIAQLSVTGAAISRQFGFTGPVLPADYPGSTVTSLGLGGAVYPMSKAEPRGRLNGFGLAGSVMTAVGSEVPVDIDGEVFDFPVSQRAWQLGVHYRYPAGPALVEGHLGYGSITHYVDDIPEDAALELDLLDAEYGFLDLGGRVEVDAGPRTTLGFAASYLYMTSVGIVTDPDLLGGAQAWGMKLGLDLKVQLTRGIYAAAGADYRRVSMVFDGDGELYEEVEVDDAKDTFVGGHLDVGVAF